MCQFSTRNQELLRKMLIFKISLNYLFLFIYIVVFVAI